MTAGLTRRDFLRYGGAVVAATTLDANAEDTRAANGIAFSDYVSRDATGLAELVRRGEVSPRELLETAIARAEQVNPQLNAIVIPHFDLARVALARGIPDGPFRGVPFLIKDLHMRIAGTVTSFGSIAFKDYRAEYTSTLVERYQSAGLVIFGKTASPEFGATATTESKLWGLTRNPWNLEHTSGGSSAAIAAGIVPAANASDGGGSIRIPAANCGLFGLKPTRARVPLGPHRFEGSDGLSVVHALTRSVRDSAGLLDISRGGAPYDPYAAPPVERPYVEEVRRAPGRLRIAWVKLPITQTPVHAECQKATENAAKLCESLGHHVEEAAFSIDAREYYEAVQVGSAVHMVRKIRAREKQLGRAIKEKELEPMNWAKLERAKEFSGVAMANARHTFHVTGERMAEMMEDYDLILTPTQAAPPEKLGVLSLSNPDGEAFMAAVINASVFTHLYNVTGQPAMSVPLHWTPGGLPIGVMFAARFGDEATLFRLAAQLEQAQPWFDRRPILEIAGSLGTHALRRI